MVSVNILFIFSVKIQKSLKFPKLQQHNHIDQSINKIDQYVIIIYKTIIRSHDSVAQNRPNGRKKQGDREDEGEVKFSVKKAIDQLEQFSGDKLTRIIALNVIAKLNEFSQLMRLLKTLDKFPIENKAIEEQIDSCVDFINKELIKWDKDPHLAKIEVDGKIFSDALIKRCLQYQLNIRAIKGIQLRLKKFLKKMSSLLLVATNLILLL